MPETIEKIHKTKRKNNTFNCSKSEETVYKFLKGRYSDVRRQYKSEQYPFYCDFYIPEKDLYIECNFHWTHGKHPFNNLDLSDIKTLEKWKEKAITSKFYKNAIIVWTYRDVLKREYVKANNLNYIELYTEKEIGEHFK